MTRTVLEKGRIRTVGTSEVAAQPTDHVMRKVPEITVYFWILKLLTTAMGETTSDFLVNRINPVVAVALGGVCLVVALIL